MPNYTELKNLAKAYLEARHIFLKAASSLPDLHGNDNIVGRIGELVAIQFLRDQGRLVEKNASSVQKGFDILTSDGEMISVKVITAENKSGRSSKIKEPWDELILIILNERYEVEKLGQTTKYQFKKAFKEGSLSSQEPYATRKLLENHFLFPSEQIFSGKSVSKYL